MLTIDQLFDADSPAAKPCVTGKWFEIRLSPDLVTGEILNIGVGFIQARTRAFHFKLLETASPFVCLYGPAAREQFGFLLSVTRDVLRQHGPSANISPHISFGDERFSQGESIEQILSSLYNSVVTIGRRADGMLEMLTPAERKAPRSTETIRKRIRRAFKSNDPNGYTDYWRDAPVVVNVDERPRPIDMQIWQAQNDLFNPRCFGAIVSACYKDEHYRKSYLNGAYHDLTIARSYMPKDKGKGGIFILRPESGDSLDMIDNEIDNTVWALEKKFGITPYVETLLDRLKEKALGFML